MKIKTHIEDAITIVNQALLICENPVFMFSGGKDSTALLHFMVFKLGIKLPVLFHREPFMVEKYQFGLKVLADWGLTAHDYPPVKSTMWLGDNGVLAWTNHYQIGRLPNGGIASLDLPKNILEPEADLPFVCARDEILNRPTAFFNYPWDLIFLGHKSSDEDQIAGKVPLAGDIITSPGNPSLAFPFRNWTDEQVWDYIQEQKVPTQLSRYNPFTRKEVEDKRLNSDYFHVCARCVDKRQPDSVFCPKTKDVIPNISHQVEYRNTKLAYCSP